MRRMHLKRKLVIKKINIYLIIFLILGIFTLYILNIFSKKAIPILMDYSKVEVKKIATTLINNAVINEVAKNITIDDLFIIKYSDEGKIISMDVNSKTTNNLLIKSNTTVEKYFKYLEKGEVSKLNLIGVEVESDKKGVIFEVPTGIIFNNVFLNNLFPKIPVRFTLIGDVTTNLKSDVKEYGINNALLEVSVEISVNFRVNLPFISNKIVVNSEIPISMKIIQGNIPDFYGGGFQSSFGIINKYDSL